MSAEFRISEQHLSGDGEHVAFTIQFGDRKTQAIISRSALASMDRNPDRDIFWVFEANHDRISEAAREKLGITQEGEILRLGSDDL